MLPHEVVVGDNDARVRAQLHHFRCGQHQVASALMEFWVVVDTHEYSSAAYASKLTQNFEQAVVLVAGIDLPLETLLVDAVIQRHPNVCRAVRDGLLPSAATFERVGQSSDTSNKWGHCITFHIVGRVVRHLDDVVPPIVMHVRLERPDVLPSFLPQFHVGLGQRRDVAHLLAGEFSTLLIIVPLDDLRNSSIGRVGIVMRAFNAVTPGSFAEYRHPVFAQMYA